MRDDYDLSERPVRLNLILRGNPSLQPGQALAFGFVVDLPPDLMEQSGGRDVHLVAECRIGRAGSAPSDDPGSPEDILERGIPAFKSRGPAPHVQRVEVVGGLRRIVVSRSTLLPGSDWTNPSLRDFDLTQDARAEVEAGTACLVYRNEGYEDLLFQRDPKSGRVTRTVMLADGDDDGDL